MAITSQASQRKLKAALQDSMCGKWPGSQQQHASSSSTPSVMASTSRCWQYVPRMDGEESERPESDVRRQSVGKEGFKCTSELQTPQLESDQPVTDFNEVDQGIEVVGGQNETVTRAVVAPSAQHKVTTK